MFKYLFLLALVIFLVINTGCSSGGGSESTQESKALFSQWTASNGSPLDLSNAYFGGQQSLSFRVYQNANCICPLNLQGSESQGTANLGWCSWTGPAPQMCNQYSQHGFTYLNVNGTLTLCRTVDNSCVAYN